MIGRPRPSATLRRTGGIARVRRGVALIDALAACIVLLVVFTMASNHLAEWSKRVADARTALVQMAIPRRVVAAFAETSSASFFPAGTQSSVFDTVTATYTRVANPAAPRVPRYAIVIADSREDASVRPDSFQVDFSPYLLSIANVEQGDTRP